MKKRLLLLVFVFLLSVLTVNALSGTGTLSDPFNNMKEKEKSIYIFEYR